MILQFTLTLNIFMYIYVCVCLYVCDGAPVLPIQSRLATLSYNWVILTSFCKTLLHPSIHPVSGRTSHEKIYMEHDTDLLSVIKQPEAKCDNRWLH